MRARVGPSERLEALTALRWIAALLVFGRHLYTLTDVVRSQATARLLPQGAVGVSFFFILSGFVLTWSRRRGDRPPGFYWRRFARVYPAYIVACVVAIVLKTIAGKPLTAAVLPSFPLLQAWVPETSVYFGVNSVNWSLAVEAFFYAAFPLIILVAVRLSAPRRKLSIAVCCALVIATAAILNPEQNTSGFWFLYVFPPVRLLEFVIGILLALEVRDDTWPRVRVGVAMATAAAAYALAGFVPEAYMWAAVTVVPFTIVIGAIAMADAAGAAKRLRHPWLVRLGVWSYAFYLVHTLAIESLDRVLTNETVVALLSLPLSVVAAACLYTLIEHPAEHSLKGRLQVRREPLPTPPT